MCNTLITFVRTYVVGIAVCMVGFLILSAANSEAAEQIQTTPRFGALVPSKKHTRRQIHPSPRLLEFNQKLAVYKQTLTKLRLDVVRLQEEDTQLRALTQQMQNMNGNSDMAMMRLQSVMSQRQSIIQFTTNVMHKLSESNEDILKHMK